MQLSVAVRSVKPSAPRNAKSMTRTSASPAGRRHAEELDADLPELPVPAGLRLLVAELRPGVPEPDRPGPVLEPVFDERPHDARRVLRPQRQRAALAVREGVHLLVDDVRRLADRAREELRRLEDRRADLAVAVEPKTRRAVGLDGGELLAVGRQEVVRALGRPELAAHRAQAPSVLKYSSL